MSHSLTLKVGRSPACSISVFIRRGSTVKKAWPNISTREIPFSRCATRPAVIFFIVHVDQILTVREASLAEMSGNRPLRLVLQSGGELKLRTCGPRHTWRSRPIDLLNGAERFVAFIQDDHSRIHVNKRHIARVEER